MTHNPSREEYDYIKCCAMCLMWYYEFHKTCYLTKKSVAPWHQCPQFEPLPPKIREVAAWDSRRRRMQEELLWPYEEEPCKKQQDPI